MTQETIDKVLSLTRNKNIADGDYELCARIHAGLTNDDSSSKELVINFIDVMKNDYGFRNLPETDELWDTLRSVIIDEWFRICERQKSKLKDIEQQLKDL